MVNDVVEIFNKDLENIESKILDLNEQLNDLNDSDDVSVISGDKIHKFFVNSQHFIIKTDYSSADDRYFLVNRTNMEITKHFEVTFYKNVHLYSNKFILGFDSISRTIQAYNLDGKLVSNADLFGLPNDTVFGGVQGKEIWFFDKEMRLYFF